MHLYAYILCKVLLLTESGFAKLKEKSLPLTIEIIFLEIGFAKINSGCYYIQMAAATAYVISCFPVPLHTPVCNIVHFMEITVETCCGEEGHQYWG